MFIGTGTTISFASGFLAEILDITLPGMSRESIQTSHMGTSGDHTFTPAKLVDNGEMVVELGFDADEDPPIDDDPETVTITFPDSGSSTWVFTGFLTGYEGSDPLEDRVTATATVKVTGGIVIS